MKESKAVYVRKRDINAKLNREYQFYATKIVRDVEYLPEPARDDQKTQEVGCQYDSKRDNLICTCRYLAPPRRRQEIRYFGSPKQIYAYQRSRSYTDIGVGSVKALQRKKVKRVYLPETIERGVGSSDLSAYFLQRTKQHRASSYYENKKTSSKCVGGILEYNTGCVINEKLSPIIQTVSGSTSYKESTFNKTIEIGSSSAVKSLTNTTTQVDNSIKKHIEIKSEVRVIESTEEVEQPIIIIQDDPIEMKTITVDSRKAAETKVKPIEKGSSSDSMLQHVHNLENPSAERNSPMSLEAEDLMENKLEMEYRNIFAAKSKSKESKHSSHTSDLKSTSTLKRRFEALRRGLSKKDDSKKNAVIVSKVSSQVSARSRKDVSINSDPPSLEGRSFSNTKPYSPFATRYSRDKTMYNPRPSHYRRSVTTNKKERGSAEWSSKAADDDSESQGVKGMFKLWGKKFNLEEDHYKRRCTPKPSYNSSKKGPSKKPAVLKAQDNPTSKPEIDEKKEGRKFFFFKNKKKTKEKPFKAKKGVTAGRCEVRDGLVIKILGGNVFDPEDIKKDPEIKLDDYEEIVRKAWLKKFLTPSIDSRNSVKVRWNNKTYAPSSSTIFELMDNIYKDTSIVFRSKSQVTVQSSYKSYTRQHVNFMQQNIEAWMVPKTITDRPNLQLPVKQIKHQMTCRSDEDRKDNMEVRISDQKWFIDKSKAFSHKIEVVLHSKNFRKLNKESSEYLRIDIPKGFFLDSSNDEINKRTTNQSSDEEVFKIVEYETGSDLKKDKATRNLNIGDHKQNKIKVTVSVKESKKCVEDVLETTITKPTRRDVVVQGSNVYIPKRCDVVGVGIITHRDLSQVRKPILKIQDDFSDEESEHNLLKPHTKKCEFAESYLQEYYRHWTPLGIDLYSWCVSDSQLKCSSEHSRSSYHNQGDGTKSCPNIFEDFQTSAIVSSCGASSCSQCYKLKDNGSDKKNKKKNKNDGKKSDPDRRILPKDSIEVFKRRKIYAASMKSKWSCPNPDFDAPSTVQSCETMAVTGGKGGQTTPQTACPKLMKPCCRPVQPKPRKRPSKKHVSLPDCDTMNDMLARQLSTKMPDSILAFKGSGCDICKKKGSMCPKHAKVNPVPICEIPRSPCRDSCELMQKPPCSESRQSCEAPPPCPSSSLRSVPSCPPTPQPCKKPSPCGPRPPPCSYSPCPNTPPPCPSPPTCPPSPPCPPKKKPPCPPSPPCPPKKKPPCPPSPPCPPKKKPPCPPSPPCPPKKKPPSPPSPPCPPKKKPPCPPSPCPPKKKPPSCPPTPRTPPSFPCPPKKPPCPPKKPPSCPHSPPCPPKKPPSCPHSPPCPPKKPPSCPHSPPCPPKKPPSCPHSPPCPPKKPPSCPPTPRTPPSPPCPTKKPPYPLKKPPSCPHSPPCPPKSPPSCPPSPPPCCRKPPPCPRSPPFDRSTPPSCPLTPPSPPPCCIQSPSCPPSPPPCLKPARCPPHPSCPNIQIVECPPKPSLPTLCPHMPPCAPYPRPSPPPCAPLPPCPPPPSCLPPPKPKPCFCPPLPSPPYPRKPLPCPHSPPCPSSPPPCPPSPPPLCPSTPPPCPHTPPRPQTPPCAHTPPCPHTPPCTPPPCIKSNKKCPKAPPTCPESPPQCCTDPDRCPALPPPCKTSSNGIKKLFKRKPPNVCPASSPCKPTPCAQSFCRSLACQHSMTSISYKALHPDAPYYYSPIHPCPPKEEPKKPKSKKCSTSPCNTSDDIPWPIKNQMSNQSSRTSLGQNNQESKGQCKRDCPLMPRMSCETIPSLKTLKKIDCKTSCPNYSGSPRLPCLIKIPGMQCPAPAHRPSPPAEPIKVSTPVPSKSKSKISGLFLKMMPSTKKPMCSNECLGWEKGKLDDGNISLNSQEKITIRLKKETPSTEEIREGLNIKVQDEDGMTLFERKDYRLQHANCSLGKRSSLLGEMYKASEIRRVTTNDSAQAIGTDKDKRKEIKEVASDASIANLIEIQFKLKVTQGEKTTEIDIANDSENEYNIERKEPKNKSTQEVFVVKNEGEQPAEHSDQKNDINIRIVIKNFKSKSGKKKSVNRKHEDYNDFSKKISAKFHTVSTGYSDIIHDDKVFSVHRATVDLTSSVDNTKTNHTSMHSNRSMLIKKSVNSNRSVEIMNKPANEIGRANLMGSSEISVCRCVTTEEEKSEDNEPKSYPSQKYSNTKEVHENAEETDTQLTDHKYEYNEDTDTDKPMKYDTEETDTDRQVDPPKYDTETDTEKQPNKKYDTFMATTDTDEPDTLPEIKKSQSLDVIVKPQTKDEKKEMLKNVMERVHDNTKYKNKTRMRKLRDMLKVILTSDSSDHEDNKVPASDLAKDVTYASLKPNYFRDTDSMNNYYKVDSKTVLSEAAINRQVVYPSGENNSDCSNSVRSVDVLSSENESKRGGCMCSTVAARLKLASRLGCEGGGCCCAAKEVFKKNEETTCDLKRESDYTQINYKTAEFVDVQTQNSRYLTSKINSTNLSVHSSIRPSLGGSFNFKEAGIKADSGVLNVDSKQLSLKKTISPERCHIRECEMRKRNRDAILNISDEENLVLFCGSSTRDEKKNMTVMHASDILQSYEAKKAVLEIYTEKTLTDDGEHLVAKLPKFVYDREQEIQANYEAMATNTYKTVCKKNIIMMAIKR